MSTRVKGKTTASALVTDGMSDVIKRMEAGSNELMRSLGSGKSLSRKALDNLYRYNWIISRIVDCPADDMARDGIELTVPNDQKAIDAFAKLERTTALWDSFTDGVRWGRLHGGSLGAILIDGQNMAEPLNIESIGIGQYKGIKVFTRWELEPSKEVIEELGRDTGLPKFYTIKETKQSIHCSRALRFIGTPLPREEREKEDGWGGSVVDKIIQEAKDIKTGSRALVNLLRFAYLRIFNIEGLRELVAAGGMAQDKIEKHFEMIAKMQDILGATVLDGMDKFSTTSYSFAGVTSVTSVLKEHASGASGIPIVRLFGQTPGGLNTDGESQITTYHDELFRGMEKDFRPKLDVVIPVMFQSTLGYVPQDWSFTFRPLRQQKDTEKSTVLQQEVGTVIQAHEAGLLDRARTLREIREVGRKYGRFQFTDAEIKEMVNEAPSSEELLRKAAESMFEQKKTEPEPDGTETHGRADGILRQRQPA